MEQQFERQMRALFAAADERYGKDAYGSAEEYLAALKQPPRRGLRYNPLKITREQFLACAPVPVLPVPYSQEGFLLDGDADEKELKPGLHPYHAAGLYYLQEPSAMICVAALAPYLPHNARVLDLCAAPGGKTTQLAAQMRHSGLLVANETVFSRAKILLGNVERWGTRNCAVTCNRPDELAARLPAYFDAVVADVPCSGEGMLRKEPEAALHWSEKNVAACAVRAREILGSAMRLLKVGGILAFSTCTLNACENEDQIAALLSAYDCRVLPVSGALRAACDRGLPPIEHALRLFPHRTAGEGHFACLIQKTGEKSCKNTTARGNESVREERSMKRSGKKSAKAAPERTNGLLREWRALYDRLTDEPLWAPAVVRDDGVYLLDADCAEIEMLGGRGLHVLRAGVKAADFADGRMTPHHQLALALSAANVAEPLNFSANAPQMHAYLAGETFSIPEPYENGASKNADPLDGWRIVQADGFNLGFVKVSQGQAKNHYPKGLRFRF